MNQHSTEGTSQSTQTERPLFSRQGCINGLLHFLGYGAPFTLPIGAIAVDHMARYNALSDVMGYEPGWSEYWRAQELCRAIRVLGMNIPEGAQFACDAINVNYAQNLVIGVFVGLVISGWYHHTMRAELNKKPGDSIIDPNQTADVAGMGELDHGDRSDNTPTPPTAS